MSMFNLCLYTGWLCTSSMAPGLIILKIWTISYMRTLVSMYRLLPGESDMRIIQNLWYCVIVAAYHLNLAVSISSLIEKIVVESAFGRHILRQQVCHVHILEDIIHHQWYLVEFLSSVQASELMWDSSFHPICVQSCHSPCSTKTSCLLFCFLKVWMY